MGIARRRAAAAVVALLACAAAAAWSATPACACGIGPGYDVYEPFVALGATVDFDGEGEDVEGAFGGPHGARFSFLEPFLLADSADPRRADEREDLQHVYDHRNDWVGALAPADSTNRPRLSDSAFVGALGRGALDRAAVAARAIVERSLDMPAGLAQVEQPLVQRAVEFLELRPRLTAAGAPPPSTRLLARFFAAPPVPRDTPRFASRDDSAAADARRLRAWRRAQVARVPEPVPDDSLPPALREAAALRRLPFADLGAAAARLPDSPRRPSLRFAALQERTRALIPAGWPSYDTTTADSAALRALRADFGRWLADYPAHPLADLVRVYSVRADRLAGDTAGAWATLLAMYPRHRARVVAEMYALLVAGDDPPAAARAAVADPLLRSALVFRTFGCEQYNCSGHGVAPYDRAVWDAEWRRAAAARPAAWAVNAEERLLRVALADTTGGPLPTAFPAAAAAPTPLWAALRAAVLVQARRWDDAAAQTALLPNGRVAAALRLRLALRARRWSEALADSALHPETRRYLLQVMADDSVLAAVVARPDRGVRGEAVRTQAARLAGAGRWAEAARLTRRARGPHETGAAAERFDRAAALAADASAAGRAAFARFLVGAQGELLGGADDRDWYRTVEGRWSAAATDSTRRLADAADAAAGVPWTGAAEHEAARRFLRTNSELYLALGAYAGAVRALPPGAPPARRRALARAADVPYNRLMNRNYEYTEFWRLELARDPAAATIRAAGRR